MKIKINGIKTIQEAKTLLEKGVDIFSYDFLVNPDRTYLSYFKQPRFLNVEEILEIKSKVELPKVSVRLELLSGDYPKDIIRINQLVSQCGLDYVELSARYDPLPVPMIYQNGISHDDYMPNHYEFSKDLQYGQRELILDDYLRDWQWLKEEAPKYPEIVKLSDIQAYFVKYPDTILNIPMNKANCMDILDHIPATTISFALGDKDDDERNYSLTEIIEIIEIVKNTAANIS